MKIHDLCLFSIIILPSFCYGLKCFECTEGLGCGDNNKPVETDCSIYGKSNTYQCFDSTYTTKEGDTITEKMCISTKEATKEFPPRGGSKLGCQPLKGKTEGNSCFCDTELCNNAVVRSKKSSSLTVKAWSWSIAGVLFCLFMIWISLLPNRLLL